MTPTRNHLSDLRGATRLAFDATAGITGIVERTHRTVQLRPGPLGRPARDRPRGITGFVYRRILGTQRLIGQALDAGLAPLEAILPEGEATDRRDALVAALNGVYGDHLARSQNPLAIKMSLRHRGRIVDPENPAALLGSSGKPVRADRLLLLVHGLCLNDRQWMRDGHDHGAALAADLGYLPLYVRYNSGLHVASNGQLLAGMLEMLLGHWPVPVKELVIVGHSMGGLVARSACYHGLAEDHAWPGSLHKLVFLGTPHHGAPLERGGHWLDLLMGLSPYSVPFARIGKMRSAGITDLRHGSITRGRHETVPLPEDVQCYAAAATLAEQRSPLAERLVGDGLVPLNSALGRHVDDAHSLIIPDDHQWTGYRIGHMEMLNHRDVYAQLRAWLRDTA